MSEKLERPENLDFWAAVTKVEQDKLLNAIKLTMGQLRMEKAELEARIAATMKHHTRKRPVGFYEDWCDECDVVWPCPTVFALEGE